MRVEPRHPLDHSIRRAGNDRRIYGMVQVAVSTHLAKPPAFAQKRCNCAVYSNHTLLTCRREICKRKVAANVVQHKTCNILCVLQITLHKTFAVFFAQLLL